ncbi:MAG: DNA gyrase subunit A [Candidatus Binatia bacterium]|nr:MAG: DNA gyrase subunit A [Candidatus Binatia bacterium]
MEETLRGHRIPVNIEDEMRQSFMDYALSVIISRAVPDARDGLKPVQRRILYAMYDLGNEWNKPYKKSARVVGDVIGKYHPHGDAPVYEAVARMAQDFSMRYPLIDGQGNFGSIDGDPPAAMRYTEIRMARIASELLADIDKETVDFVPNYDETLQEPVVLPSRIPNLLINGAAGIAVGMATSIPPHNLNEVVEALIALVEHPDLTVEDLMEYVAGPDFPTGALILGRQGIQEAYRTGRGSIPVRGRATIETEGKNGRQSIVITEIPYQVNKARLIERIAELVNEKRITGIADLRDESDREGLRIVVDLKRDAVPEVVLNQLYKLSDLQTTFNVAMLAIVDRRPRLLNLREALQVFLDHRRHVIVRRTSYELRQAEERLHILDGLKAALDHLDEVIQLIRAARDPAEARAALMGRLALSERQAQAILDMRLQRLTSLEREKLLQEREEVIARIARYRQILADDREVSALIVEELREIQKQYGDARRTEIVEDVGELSREDLVPDEEVVVTISHAGYVKRSPLSEYRSQRRGGRGLIGATTREEDFVEHLFVASTHAYLLVFTTSGKVFWLKVYEIPQAARAARGKAIVNLLELNGEEKISAVLPVRNFEEDCYVFFATRKGTVKKTPLQAFANPRRAGIAAISLAEGDEVIGVRLTDGRQEIILSTAEGQSIRFREEEVRPMGRTAAGVRGIALDGGDSVVGVDVVDPEATLLAVSEKGFGKRTPMDEYRVQSRGGKGIITMRVTERTGKVVGVRMVRDEDEAMLVTDSGRVIRFPVRDVSVIGRNTQGVRLIELDGEERVVALARLAERDSENHGEPTGGSGNGAPPSPPEASAGSGSDTLH